MKNKNIKKKILAIFILLFLIVSGAVIIKKKKEALKKVPPPLKRPVIVQVVKPEYGSFGKMKKYLGTIRAKVTADIAPKIQGHIIEVRVRQGQRVKKGDVLAIVDDRQILAQINSTKARIAAAKVSFNTQKAIFERDKRLFNAKAISKEQLEISRAKKEAALAELKVLSSTLTSLQIELSYARLQAPFDGIVTERFQDPGDFAVVGKPILSIEDPSAGYFVEIKIPQTEFALIKKGAKVLITKDAEPSRKLELSISRIHPAITKNTLATVEADISKQPFGLPTGATVSAQIETGIAKGFKVPLKALLENVNSTFVFIVNKDNTIDIKEVNAIYKGPFWAVIAANGLSRDTRLVIGQESALLRLHQGQKVSIRQEGTI